MQNDKEDAGNNIKIIYEDKNVLVINKPAGLVVHGDGRTEEYTLVDWLLENYPDIESVGEHWVAQNGEVILRPGIVHRLDRDTSGILIIAKTQESYEHLKEQFKERKVQKEYRAIVYGAFKDDEQTGVIDKPIGKSPADFRRWSAQPGARGRLRDAVTEYRVLNTVGIGQDGFSYLSVFPRTGRTHQIRVHLKAIHHPIVADGLYAPKKKEKLGLNRHALHAFAIKINLPELGESRFEATLAKDFSEALKRLKNVLK